MQREQAKVVARASKSLAHATRVLIVASLVNGPRTIRALSVELKVRQPLITHHMVRLRMAGVVQLLRKGKKVYYGLNPEKLELVGVFFAKLI